MASNRERANRSLGNKISSLDGRLQQTDKNTADPHISVGAVSDANIADKTVTESSLYGRAVGPESLARGAVGTEHLGIVNQINSDSNMLLTVGDEGRIQLSGTLYDSELPPVGGKYTLAVDNDGMVSVAPNIPGTGPAGNVMFHAWRTAGDVTAPAYVIYNIADVNVGGAYNATTGVFTAPITGRYYFHAYSIFGNVAGTYRMYFYKNSAAYNDLHIRANPAGTGYDNAQGRSIIMSMSAGDTMRIYFSQGTAVLFANSGSYTAFAGYLLG